MVDTKSKAIKQKSRTHERLSAAHQKLRAHYYTYMPDKKHHRVLIWVAFFMISGIIALQLLYPVDRALPLARLDGQDVIWQNDLTLAKLIDQKFRDSKVHIEISGKTVEKPLAEAGAEPNTDEMIRRLTEYPFWQRFIPLSIFARPAQIKEANVYYTDSVLKTFSIETAKALTFAPTDARLAIKDGTLIATPDTAGSVVTAEAVHDAVAAAQFDIGTTTRLTVPSKHQTASKTAADLAAVRTQAEAALARQVQISAGDQAFAPDKPTVASWLVIGADDKGQTVLSVDTTSVGKYIDTIDAKVGTPAGVTNINLTNGRETSRTPGATGKAIDREALIPAIDNYLLQGVGTLPVIGTLVDTQPSIMYDHKYTTTQEGLQAYLDDTSARMDVHIVVQQLDGGKWYASTRSNDSIPSASTYKLFVAKWLFDQMDKGLVHWDDPWLDTTVSGCFDRMTIASTNPCAEAWLAEIGRTNMNNYVYGLGFSQGTSFTEPDATHTTANDLEKYMIALENGSIMSPEHRDRLLHSLSTHPYRYGIPTGSAGQVWDKVGFLWDYVHDTAIVYHPKGHYVMTIMTKGQSYATIANLTREIERIMYP